MTFIILFLFYTFLNVVYTQDIQSLSFQPRIVAEDGHLLIYAAEHKNISFIAPGKGVHVNGIDILQSTKISNNALQQLRNYQSNFASSFEKISKLERLIDDGLLRKINDVGSFNTTDIPVNSPSVVRSIRRLNRRVNKLQKSMRLLTLLLTVDECSSNPCKNGATCQDLFNGFICQCPAEWEGALCDKNVNECARFAGTDLGCQNGATCIDRPGTYECVCPRGWFGLHCTQRTNDCKSGSNAELCGHGTCVTQYHDAGYKCICDQGWTTDGTSPACNTDVNECTMNKPPCSVNPPVPCINLPGSFHCGNCPQGYSGNGYHCIDIDECATSNGGCSTNPMVQCINTLGSRMCGSCPSGYTGDGIICSYSGVCNVQNGGCHPLATCRSNPRISSTSVECICPSGYVGNGIGPSGCTRTLIPTINACSPNPCSHGTCRLNGTNNYICDCYRRYTGRNCDSFRDVCVSSPCQNGATCMSILGVSFRCICPAGFTGYRCDNERQACGGQLNRENGTLAFPIANAQNYGHSLSCAWTIETNETKVLNITFTSFNIEDSYRCRYDWLQIHDGTNTMSRSIGRFCGHDLPNGGTIISTHNVVYLWFRSDHSVASSGFNLTWTSISPYCGQELQFVTTHGTIHSPGSPGNYPNSRDCYWPLQTQPGKRFLFHFFSLMIGNNSNCDADYLEFITGTQYSDPVFAKFCNTSHPTPLFSQGSEVLVHFHSDATLNYPGFQITYSVVEGMPGCGGVYTQHQAEIRSPSFNGNYPNDIQCEYKIQLSENSRIKLTFLSFALEQSEGCQFDYVAIYAGSTVDAPLIGKYCGNTVPPTYTTEGNQLLVVLKTDWANTDGGFVLKYETVCGGKFTVPSGTFNSPGYPNKYDDSVFCVYEIIQPLGSIIKLQILDFNLETTSSPHCSYDFLEIRDGHDENSTLVGKYCDSYPPLVVSTYNYLYIKFQSDDNNNGRGFKANYTTETLGCGGIMKDATGTFSTPNYPQVYLPGTTCKWIIAAPSKHVIQIIWMNFQVEKSFECMYDFVEVFDNNTETGKGTSIGKFCGPTNPPTILSTSNLVTVTFFSDRSHNLAGFLASYNTILESNVCGGNYYSDAGTLKSPGYPDNYPTNMDCVWTIQVKPGHQILLNVTDFELEQYSICRYDWLEIRNGGSSTSPLLGKYCGTTIPKIIPSHTNKMYIYFRSDMTRSRRGFKITWESTATGCGGTLTSPTGSIISPNYPEPYSVNTECMWKISISTGSLIQVVFSDLDLEEHTHCMLDYVEILDGPSLNSKSLGRFCSSTHSSFFIRSTSNTLTVKFRSDISRNGRGFQLQYTTMCNNTLKGFDGVIESPNFPNNYPNSVNCNWEIEVPNGNKLSISFSHFDLEKISVFHQIGNQSDSNKCNYDFVEILYIEPTDDYEEEGDFQKYGTYCGIDMPPLITLNSSHAQIRFVTDTLIHGNGFRLEWQIEGCGEVLTHPNGTIESPNYPKAYPPSVICNWKIIVDYGQHIEITFPKLEIEESSSCNLDYVRLYNGEDDTYPEVATICHQNKPVTLRSSGNLMFIQFKADHSVQAFGFRANYTSKPTKCGGKYLADHATIMSPNYPQNYDVNDTCGYEIQITEGHVIALNFEDFDLFEDENVNCSTNNNSYVKVYDGPTTDFPLRAKICGKDSPNETIVSTTNQMFIEMVTRTDIVAKGFLAKYRRQCGARLETEGSGTIQVNPNDLDYYDYNCSWTIISKDPSKHVSLTITHLDLMFSFCDDGDYKPLKIYNGDSSKSPLLASFCESKIPPTLTSDGSALHIDIEYNTAFFATYSVFDSHCGGTLTSIEGAFASPGYPRKYPIDTECEWILTISEGNHVTLSFSDFGLLESDHCNTDYLEIRQNNGTGKLLGTFCGDEEPTNITNVGSLWIFLKTSRVEGDLSGITAKGFRAEYLLNHENELSGPSGRIVSPLYNLGYPFSGEFSWTISVNYGHRILLTFKDMVLANGEQICFASLWVYDGPDEESPLVKEYCGTTLPDAIKSATNKLFIKFNGYSSSRTSTRFILEWMEVEEKKSPSFRPAPNITCGNPEPINLNALQNYTEIKSPGYPYGYDKNLKCEWIITTIPMNHIVIRFKEMDLPPSYGLTCYGDYVEVFEKKLNEDWTSLRKICRENITSTSIHTSNMMKVMFNSDFYVNKTGFAAIVNEACGGVLSAPTDYIIYNNITRLGYTRMYLTECQWNITVAPGKTIEIEFLEFDIHHDKDKGCNNFLILRNGIFPDSPILGDGKYCGSQPPQSLKTTSNNAYIKYSGLFGLANFKLRYREISYLCGGDISLTQFDNSTEISSPNYPLIPPAHVECLWRIRGPPGEIIRIDFIDRFDISTKGGKECPNEFVQIRDGATIYSRLVGTFCGKKPNSQFSTDNMMLVRFFTQLNEPSNGFKARVTLANCGGSIHDTKGQIQSPFFNRPTQFPVGANCTWHLIAPFDHAIKIKFDKIDLMVADNCTVVDHVWIYEPNNVNNGVSSLGTFCGKQIPDPIQSAGNEVLVNLQTSKMKKEYSGFSLKFNSTEDVCGGTIEALEGIIQSPGYPAPHKSYKRCGWYIKVPRGRRVTATIEDIDLNPRITNSWLTGIAIYNNHFRGFVRKINSNKDKKVESTENHMFIYYWSSGSGGRGFKLRFTSNEPSYCQGDLNQDSGLIRQPNTSFPYFCTYIREKRAPGTTFVMKIIMTTNATQGNSKVGCHTYHAVVNIESDEAQGPIHTVECVPSSTTVRSPFSHLKVSIYEYIKRYTTNYTISFNTYQCGGILSSETGVIKSPAYPNTYSKSIECSWLLKLPQEQTIRLTFDDLNLGDNCEKSYLDIYNGESPNSPKIDRYCQTNKPSVLISQTNTLWIEYKFDKDSNAKGFSLKYEPKIQGCGGIFHDRNRIIETPSFPDDYPNNAECLWELRTDEGYHIGFSFTTRFQIEQSENCKNDFVEISDWKDNKWVSLGKKCGREFPNSINSTSNRLKILFRSNERIAGKGFRAMWEWNCGGNFTADKTERFIVSPNFPVMYPKNLNCLYQISAGSGSGSGSASFTNINIKFYNFELEGTGSNCKYDNFTISQLNSPYLPKQTFCGSKIPPNIRLPIGINLHFQTDRWVQKAGFKFSYQLDDCISQITTPTVIKTPEMTVQRNNLLYRSYLYCSWNITAPPKKTIVIKFQKFDLALSSGCYYNNLEIFEGYWNSPSKRLANLCGNLTNNPPVIKIENGSAFMVLKGDMRINQDGFTAFVYFADGPAEGCGGRIQLEDSTTITAPNLQDMDCAWFVQSPVGTSIKVHFDELNLPVTCGLNQTHQNCSCASLEIKDGHPSIAETIESFCGISNKNFGRELTSSRNSLGIRVYTRGATNKAFQIKLRTLPSPCGPMYLNVSNDLQTLVSPGYPEKYPSDIKCTWLIKSTENFVIRFVDFDLNEEGDLSNVCGEDRLEIMEDKSGAHVLSDGLGPSFVMRGVRKEQPNFYPFTTLIPGIHIFCGKSLKPFDYYNNFNSFLLKFSSGNSEKNRGRGFKLQYQTVGCNRNYTSLQGRINEVIKGDCYLTITVPQNYTIAVSFQRIILYNSNKCENAGMEIRDGSDKAPVLLRTCAFALPNPVFSKGNTLWMHLWNKGGSTRIQVDLVYTSSDKGKGCGGTLYNYRGSFTSPLYPMAYKNSTPCEWDVRVPAGMAVAIKFSVFDIQDDCDHNYLKVTTFETSEGNEHTFCKNSNPAILYSNSHLLVKYQSSINNGGTGWMASFEAVMR